MATHRNQLCMWTGTGRHRRRADRSYGWWPQPGHSTSAIAGVDGGGAYVMSCTWLKQVSANGLTSHACFWPPLVCTPKAYASRMVTRVRTRALSQSNRHVPPANQDARCALTRTPPHNIVQNGVLIVYSFPVSLSCLWLSCQFNLGDRYMAEGSCWNKLLPYMIHQFD